MGVEVLGFQSRGFERMCHVRRGSICSCEERPGLPMQPAWAGLLSQLLKGKNSEIISGNINLGFYEVIIPCCWKSAEE
jgi:hypothetical protein